MKRSIPAVAMMVATVVLMVGLPLVTWALVAGGPATDAAEISQGMTGQGTPTPWLMMAMGVGFLAVSGWYRWQGKPQEKTACAAPHSTREVGVMVKQAV